MSPLCSDQQVISLQTEVVGVVRPEHNIMQEVEGDVFGKVVTRLQQVRQQLQGALRVVLLNSAVNQRKGLIAQLLWRCKSLSLFKTGGKKKNRKRTFYTVHILSLV